MKKEYYTSKEFDQRPESGDGSEEKKKKKRSTQLTMNRKLDSRIDDCSHSNFPKI